MTEKNTMFRFDNLELRYQGGELLLIHHEPYGDGESEEFLELVIEFPLGPSPNDDSFEEYEKYIKQIGTMISFSFNYCSLLFPFGPPHDYIAGTRKFNE